MSAAADLVLGLGLLAMIAHSLVRQPKWLFLLPNRQAIAYCLKNALLSEWASPWKRLTATLRGANKSVKRTSSDAVKDLNDADCVFQPGAATVFGGCLAAIPLIFESISHLQAHQCGMDGCHNVVSCVCKLQPAANATCNIDRYIHVACARDWLKLVYLVLMPLLMIVDCLMHRKHWAAEVR